jgi:hypothetical protein
MNHRNILTAAVLAASLGVAHASLFNPVGPQIREANNNWSLGFIHQSLSYYEVPPVAGLPNPLDSETGGLNGIHWDWRHQHSYLGWGFDIDYLQTNLFGGPVTYNGYLENLQTGALTPASGRTNTGEINGQLFLRGGFSPMRHMAMFLGVVAGGRSFGRNNLALVGGTDELYHNFLAGGDASLQYAVGPVVLDLSGIVGRTFGSQMRLRGTTLNPGTTFILGNSPYHRIGLKVTYAMTPHLSLYTSYHRVTYSYGASATNSAGVMEPASHTTESSVQVGVRVHNFF